MQEENDYVPMDIDSDENNDDDNNSTNMSSKSEDTFKQEQAAMKVVISWLLQKKGKSRVRDIDPWDGFISPSSIGKIIRSSHEYKMQFTLSQLFGKNCPYPITIEMCKNGKSFSDLIKQVNLEDTSFYPFHFIVKRWDNRSGIDLGCNMIKSPGGEMADEVMKNIPGAVAGNFMVMKNNTTQDSYRTRDGEAADGVALAGRDFGVVNEKFLKAFGCIEKHHLTRGCLEIPKDIAEKANLSVMFSNLRQRTFVPTLGKKKHQKSFDGDNEESNPMDIDEDVNRFYLVPCTSLIAWMYDGMDDTERAECNVYALQIRSRNKNTGEVTKPYWIVDDLSFAWMIHHSNKRLVEKVDPMTSDEIGMNIYPFKNPETWNNPIVIEELTPIMTKKEVSEIQNKKREFYVKFYVGCVLFPRELKNAENLAPIVPSDWYDSRRFKNNKAPPIAQVAHNINQRKK